MLKTSPNRLFILCLLGTLSVISPFSIDMYLPAFPQIAAEFHIASAQVSLTLSSYFIGLAAGQVLYGPFLDRYGRKTPLCIGLAVFVLASVGCFFAHDIHALVLLRFMQALGGCAAQVASIAMVRDFFPPQESAAVFSRLFLFIGVSPLLAPTIGGLIVTAFGWKVIFFLLGAIVAVIWALVHFLLPEGHAPDPGISLKPGMILAEFMAILRNPRFCTYALAGAFSFAGLFTYVAGSPIIFMEGYHLSAHAFGAVFALLAMGFIGSNQLNVMLLRRFGSRALFSCALAIQTATGILFLLGTALHLFDLYLTLLCFFVFLSCVGLTYPNAAAMALEPFSRNVGSAAALLGFLQLGIGALISASLSVTASHSGLPIIATLAITAAIACTILLAGHQKANVVISE